MSRNTHNPKADLRRRAEEALSGAPSTNVGKISDDTVRRLIHDLKVHQTELEFQNEELRDAQTDLARSRDRFFTLYHQAPVGYTTLNPAGMILEANQTLADLTGRPISKLLHRPFSELVHPDDQALFFARFKAFFRHPEGKDIEIRLRRQDGGVRHVRVEGRVSRPADASTQARLLTIISDISERKLMEGRLRENERRFRTIVDVLPQWVCCIDLNFRVQFVNKGSAEAFNLFPDAAAGQKLPDVMGLDFFKRIRPRIDQALAGERVRFYEIVDDAEGKPRHIDAALAPHIDDDGNTLGVYAILTDITHYKEGEEERRKLEERLQQTQKIEALGALAGGIAHDVNNVLFPIMGYAEMTLDSLEDGTPLKKNIDEILKAAKRARNLVRQILAFSRRSGGEKAAIQIQSIVKETAGMLNASLPKNIEMRILVSQDCGYVWADPTNIHQVLMNLATNAYHALKENGGLLEIRLEDTLLTMGGPIAERHIPPGSYVRLAVKDTGVGMSRYMQNQIFDPYFTTRPKGEGTGLGLSVVHGIVKECGGFILVDSAPGKGSEFRIYLPRVDPPDNEKDGDAGQAVPGGTERILLVDDEDDVLDMLQQMLGRLGYHLKSFKDATQALFTFKARPDAFDLVLTDAAMPGLNGIDLIQKLKQIRKDIPVILITGFSDQTTEQSAASLGVSVCLTKPLARLELAGAIRDALD